MIDVDRLVPIKLELPVDLLPIEGFRLFLCYPDEDDAVARAALSPKQVGDVVLLLLVRKPINRNLLPFLRPKLSPLRGTSPLPGPAPPAKESACPIAPS